MGQIMPPAMLYGFSRVYVEPTGLHTNGKKHICLRFNQGDIWFGFKQALLIYRQVAEIKYLWEDDIVIDGQLFTPKEGRFLWCIFKEGLTAVLQHEHCPDIHKKLAAKYWCLL